MNDYPQITVSIGRNYGHGAKSPVRGSDWFGRPMTATVWKSYKAAVYDMLAACGATIAWVTEGSSWWKDHTGVICREQSYTVAAIGISPAFHYGVKAELRSLCRQFQQDSIAVTVSDPAFIRKG